MPGSEEQFVASYAENYVASYRVRAALALGIIGGADARQALEAASRMPMREDVREASRGLWRK